MHFISLFVFRLNTKQDTQKYGQVILDFSYFNSPNEIEKKIETNPVRNIAFIRIIYAHVWKTVMFLINNLSLNK